MMLSVRGLSAGYGGMDAVRELERAMIQRNRSPGGCTDLLAITHFLHFMWEEKISPKSLFGMMSTSRG